MRVLLSLVLLVAISNAASAQTIQRIDITDVGIYELKVTGTIAAPGTVAGVRTGVSSAKLVEATTTIPGRLGVHFGFRYKIIGQTGRDVLLKNVTLIPQPGIRDPNTGKTTVRSGFSVNQKIGIDADRGYTFDNPMEIVTGTWTFELWDGDRKLVSQSLNVVAP